MTHGPSSKRRSPDALRCCGVVMLCKDSRPYDCDAGNIRMRKILTFLRRRRYQCQVCRVTRTTLELDYDQAQKMLANEARLRTLLDSIQDTAWNLGIE